MTTKMWKTVGIKNLEGLFYTRPASPSPARRSTRINAAMKKVVSQECWAGCSCSADL